MAVLAPPTPRTVPRARATSEPLAPALRRWLIQHREAVWIASILICVTSAHAINMFHFPYYENDEGTYISQAWSVLTQGELAPYTYWYDHAPLGWLQLALWYVLSGGFYMFGTSVDSGRVLMLLMQVGSTLLLYQIARVSSKSRMVATLAALAFALSPYGIYFHRRVLLDNISTFWMLVSIWLVMASPLRLSRILLSGLALGISVLSKEITLFVIPAVLLLVFSRAHPRHRLFASIGWLAIVGSMFSVWVLMAAIKGELFPTGTFLGGNADHVSLLGTLQYQMSRGKDGGLLQSDSGFWRYARLWAEDAPFLVWFGTAGAVVAALGLPKYRVTGSLGLATLSLWAFLARGGEVIGFYLVPLLPLLALNAGLLFGAPASWLMRLLERGGRLGRIVRPGVALATLAACAWLFLPAYASPNLGFANNGLVLWNNGQADAQSDSTAWIRKFVDPSQTIVIEDFLWTDLHDGRGGTQSSYPLAHWYWKVDLDPAIRNGPIGGDWHRIDYMVGTPQMWGDLDVNAANLQLLVATDSHSTPIAHFDTGGWPVTVRRANKVMQVPASSDPVLKAIWADYMAHLVTGGRIVNPRADGQTTADAQASALLQTVYLDDRNTFDTLWNWTANHLLRQDDLLAAGWDTTSDASQDVVAPQPAPGATQDAALALLFASRLWNAPEYQQAAQVLLDGIWQHDSTTSAQHTPDVDSTNASDAWSVAPEAYRVFARADARHPWTDLLASSYDLVESEGLSDVQQVTPGSARLLWHLALDRVWFGENRGQALLDAASLPDADAQSTALDAGPLAAVLARGDSDNATQSFATTLLEPFVDATPSAKRADPDDPASNSRAWLASALFDGGLSDLWDAQTSIDWDAAGY